MINFTRWTIHNPVPINLITVLVIILGLGSFFMMNRELFPEFQLDIVQVRVEIEGGSTPEQVDKNVVQVINPNIETIEGIKRIRTVADENQAVFTIEVSRGYDPQKIKDDVQSEIDTIRTLPDSALKPTVEVLEHFIQAIFVGVQSNHSTGLELRESAEWVKNDMQYHDVVSRAEIYAPRPIELSVSLPLEHLHAHNLTIRQIADQVRGYNFEVNSGEIRDPYGYMLIKADARKTTASALQEVPIHYPNGEFVRLKDLTGLQGITYGFSEVEAYTEVNGLPASVISIEKAEEEDVIDLCRGVRDYCSTKQLPNGSQLTPFSDFSELVQGRLSLVTKNALQGVILVLLVLSIFLQWETAFWVSAGIAFSLVGAGAVLMATGGTINMLTLFGFLIAIGIVVDDAIVIGEDFYDRRQQGESARDAAMGAVRDMKTPVLAMMTTTILAFIPLFFVTGVMGKFIEVFPVVVIGALVLSLIESLFILPVHLAHHGGSRPTVFMTVVRVLFFPLVWISNRVQPWMSARLQALSDHVLVPLVRWVVFHRYAMLIVGAATSIFIAGLVPAGIVKTSLFPTADSDLHKLDVEFPKGTPLAIVKSEMHKATEALVKVAKQIEEEDGINPIESYFLEIGSQGAHKASVLAKLISADEGRLISGQGFKDRWRREAHQSPQALSYSFQSAQAGPDAKPIEIILSSNDESQIRTLDIDIRTYMETLNGVVDITSSERGGAQTVDVRLKPEFHSFDLSEQEVISAVADAFSGVKIDTFYRGDNEVKTYIRAALKNRNSLDELKAMQLSNGMRVDQVADLRLYQSPSDVRRTDGKRSITVASDVDTSAGANAAELRAVIADYLNVIVPERYPNVLWEYSGEAEEGNDAINSMILAFIPALMAMYAVLATIFRSYLQPIVIMAIIPIAALGAIIGHFVMGLPFNLMSGFGIIALTGVAVNDSLVLVDCINEQIRKGMSIEEGIATGSARRQRPILLTSITTVAGLSGILFETSFQAQFLIPLVTSLAFGIMYATIVIFFFVPVLYTILLDFQVMIHRLIGDQTSREDLIIANGHGYKEH